MKYASNIFALSLDEAVIVSLAPPKVAKLAMPCDIACVAAKRAQIGAIGKALARRAIKAERERSLTEMQNIVNVQFFMESCFAPLRTGS
ncbi:MULTISPECIES: hypothetical protein [Sphingopyxis]|uniref:hypothetical protein n=1 Tax=Sphingopyxis TaxID=165697 RepID=UPI001C2B981D|nr:MULTISPECIES: hypothetical protein [Sphingopyxis]QXF12954.1 hypothetical protein HBA51_12935 [Sphingopyxis terrae subsp. terrae]